MECDAVESERRFTSLKMDKENCLKEAEELRQELNRHKDGTDLQTEIAKSHEKFVKMRDIYNSLRAEHIELLRKVSVGF